MGTIAAATQPRRRRFLRLVALLSVLGGLTALPEVALRQGWAFELLRGPLTGWLQDACGLELRVERVRGGLVGTWVRLEGLEVQSAAGAPVFTADDIELDLATGHLLGGVLRVQAFRVERPRGLLRLREGRWIDAPTCGAGPSETSEEPPRWPPFSVWRAEIFDGRLEVEMSDARASLERLDLQVREVGRGAEIDLDVDEVRVEQDGAEAWRGLGPQARIELALPPDRARRLSLSQLRLASPAASLEARGFIDDGMNYRLAVLAQTQLERLESHLPASPPLRGLATLSATVAGAWLAPVLQASVRLEGVHVADKNLGARTDIRVRATPDGLDIERVEVQQSAGGGRAIASGHLDFDSSLTLRARADTRQFSFARLMASLGTEGVWVDFAGTGHSEVTGTLRPLRLEGPLAFDLTPVRVWKGPWHRARRLPQLLQTQPTRVTGRWTFTDGALDIRGAKIRGKQTRGVATALIHHGDPEYIRIDTDFSRLDLDEVGPVAGLALSGTGSLIGTLSGPFSDLRASGLTELKAIRVGQWPLGDARARIAWDGKDQLDFGSIEGKLASILWKGSVGVDFAGEAPVRLRARLLGGRLGDLMFPLEVPPRSRGLLGGRVAGTVALDGPVERWSGPVDLRIRDFEGGGLAFPLGGLRAELRDGRVRIHEAQLRREADGDPVVEARGRLDIEARTMTLTASVAGLELHELPSLAALAPTLNGTVDGALRAEGPWFEPRGRGALEVRSVRAGERGLGSGRAELELGGGMARVRASVPAASMGLSAEVRLDDGLGYSASLALQQSDLPTRIGIALGAGIAGASTARLNLQGSLLEPMRSNGRAELDALSLAVGDIELDLRRPAVLPIERGIVRLDDVSLRGPVLRADVSGYAGVSTLNLDVEGGLELEVLPRWLTSIERSSGRVLFNGSLVRGSDGVVFDGQGEVEGAAIEVAGLRNRISGIRGRLSFSKSGVSAEALTGRWAGGKLNASGSIGLQGYSLGRFSLRAAVRDARPRIGLVFAELSGRLDGAVDVEGVWPDLKVRGYADVRRARVTPRTDVADLVGSRRLAAAYDPAAEIVTLDVALGLVDGVRVKNDDLDLQMNGQLRLTGTNERVGLLGSLALEPGGRVGFVGREYETESGLIELRGRTRIEPRYDLALSTQACDARIRVRIEGGWEEVRTQYSSSPEMNPEDIASCIVRGIRRRDLDSDLASFAGSALLKLSGVDRQVKRVLPIDQLDVTTEFSNRSRSYEPRLLVAKELSLLGRSLRLEYSTSLLRNEDQRAAVRVRLTPNLSLRMGWEASEDVPLGDWGIDLERRWTWGH